MRYLLRKKIPISGLVNGIQLNLLDDLDEFCEKNLEEHGIKRKDMNDPTMDYCRLQRRLIDVHKRRVYKPSGFAYPNKYEKQLQYLQYCIETGKNLNPFMTRRIKNLQLEDMLLYDWNIYHFHLSDILDIKNDGFMERSDQLLMAYVTTDAIYFLKIVPHDEIPSHLWANKEYIQIIRDNWPWLIEKNLLKGVSLSQKITEEEYYNLRKAHISTFTELTDGSLYGVIGGGYASDGSSSEAVHQADYLRRVCGILEGLMSQQFWILLSRSPELYERLKKDTLTPIIHLIGTNGHQFLLIEPNIKIMFKVDHYKTKWRFAMASFEESYKFF